MSAALVLHRVEAAVAWCGRLYGAAVVTYPCVCGNRIAVRLQFPCCVVRPREVDVSTSRKLRRRCRLNGVEVEFVRLQDQFLVLPVCQLCQVVGRASLVTWAFCSK